MDINEVRALLNHKTKKKVSTNHFIKSFTIKVMISIILFLSVLILIKVNKDYKPLLKKEIFEKSFQFTAINTWYKKYLGGILPFDHLVPEDLMPVFNSNLVYQEKSKFLDGVRLKVEQHYLVPLLESGTVVFIGDKEGYGKSVIVQQVNGVDLWYGNVDNLNVKLYDYVEKGTLLGECTTEELYLVYQKEGKFMNYEDYLS